MKHVAEKHRMTEGVKRTPKGEMTGVSAERVVREFLDALNEEDFDAAKECLHAKMKFDGVMGSRDGADAYIQDMQKIKFKYDIQKIFSDGDDVCVLYDIAMSKDATIFTCGLYRVTDGKIASLKVVFDPRPLLEKSNKN